MSCFLDIELRGASRALARGALLSCPRKTSARRRPLKQRLERSELWASCLRIQRSLRERRARSPGQELQQLRLRKPRARHRCRIERCSRSCAAEGASAHRCGRSRPPKGRRLDSRDDQTSPHCRAREISPRRVRSPRRSACIRASGSSQHSRADHSLKAESRPRSAGLFDCESRVVSPIAR